MTDQPYFSNLVYSAETIRQLDQTTIEKLGIPGFTLMEIAGRGMARGVLSKLDPASEVLIVAGKGNNGGDALVIARYLLREGHHIKLYLMSSPNELSEDAHTNYKILERIASSCPGNLSVLNPDGQTDLSLRPATPDAIVDGLLGTGLNSELRGHYAEVVKWINAQDIPTYAVDIPTGLHPDTGEILGNAVQADYTWTFGANKPGFYLNEGPKIARGVHLIELPFPPHGLLSPKARILSGSEQFAKTTNWATHKYETGVVWIVAGSNGLTGAARLAAQSAWAQGAGAVFLITPQGLSVEFSDLDQIIKCPVGEAHNRNFKSVHVSEVSDMIKERPGTVLLGPGLGRAPETVDFVTTLLLQLQQQVVIDADALWALSQQWVEKPAGASWILTPHPGELKQLGQQWSGNSIPDIADDAQRLSYIQSAADEHQLTILSKGKPTISAYPDQAPLITSYETRLFARAGFGDVLSGAIATHWSRGSSVTAAVAQALVEGWQRADQIYIQGRSPQPLDLCSVL
ncbi:MAG: NAD(P)H-hydrate epimerase [Bacteroidota bacterium]